MTRIALLSDIHGNMPALEKVLEDVKARQVDRIFCLGDLISGPLWPKETITFLMQQDWVFVRGNHDRNLVERDPTRLGPSDAYARKFLGPAELDWLAKLPLTREVENTFLLCHGSPTKEDTYLLENIEHGRIRLSTPAEIKSRLPEIHLPVLFCGHSHTPRVICLDPDLTLINPGSVGVQGYEDDDDEYFVVENGSPHARYAVIEETPAGWKAEIILVPYDHGLAVAQARRNNRPDYVLGLGTGYLRGDSIPVFRS